MSLPIFQTESRDLGMLQTKWASILNPIVNAQQNKSIILENVSLINGITKVNHLLGRKLQGWKIVRQRASASIYDTQDSNSTPELTLSLVSNAAVVVDIEVF